MSLAAAQGERPRRPRLTGSARERQLLDVAERLFTERGYEGVSIEDIARAAGVSRPVVYQHHGSKDGIFVACVRRARQDLERRLCEAAVQTDDWAQQIEAGGRVFFELVAADPERWVLLFTTSASQNGELSDQLGALRFQTIAAIADQLRSHVADAVEEDLFAFAYAVSGVGEQLGRWWLRYPAVSVDQVVAHYRRLVFGMAQAMLADQLSSSA
ncbi:TetR/AcrR family transcriptional regulator [Frankia sp. R82]|uniref:TetR/AcrR family transcriptional regulator n=1 Tax=Frankia sp. R82 TaxID=2950553 RepID=UPI0020439A86|nr:TetR/AcrR family transcriptional regulator [Frankia sp. R82]MCM3883843.1 TetR/AcrR family transcriptional regulator [Frankia sp. R82]